MQIINDFTCSLTNHNARWLNIYNDGKLYLANAEDLHRCVRECVSVYSCLAMLQASVCVEYNLSDMFVALSFTLTSVMLKKQNLCESCCDTEIRSTAGLPRNAKPQ